MGLGKHLVRELGFEDGVDTLGRWMSHHLAELIYEAENGETEEVKLRASQQATETILKIWEHRKNLPGEAYPLVRYEDLLKVIDLLRIDNNQFRFYRHTYDNIDKIASILFDNFTRMILSILFLKLDALKAKKAVDGAAIESLDDEEKRIWLAIQEWATIFKESDQEEKTKKKGKNTKKDEINLKKNILILINNIRKHLDDLTQEIKE